MPFPMYIVDYDSDTGEYDLLKRKTIQLHGKEIITTDLYATAVSLDVVNHICKLLNDHEKNNPIG